MRVAVQLEPLLAEPYARPPSEWRSWETQARPRSRVSDRREEPHALIVRSSDMPEHWPRLGATEPR